MMLVYWLCNPNDQVHNCAIAFGCTSGVKLPKHLTGMWWWMAGQPVWSGLIFPWRSPEIRAIFFHPYFWGVRVRGPVWGDRWPIIFHQASSSRRKKVPKNSPLCRKTIDFLFVPCGYFWFGNQKHPKTKSSAIVFFNGSFGVCWLVFDWFIWSYPQIDNSFFESGIGIAKSPSDKPPTNLTWLIISLEKNLTWNLQITFPRTNKNLSNFHLGFQKNLETI